MRSKNFQNMRHQPLLNGSPDALILELIVPPELHLMLGLYCHQYWVCFGLNIQFQFRYCGQDTC